MESTRWPSPDTFLTEQTVESAIIIPKMQRSEQ